MCRAPFKGAWSSYKCSFGFSNTSWYQNRSPWSVTLISPMRVNNSLWRNRFWFLSWPNARTLIFFFTRYLGTKKFKWKWSSLIMFVTSIFSQIIGDAVFQPFWIREFSVLNKKKKWNIYEDIINIGPLSFSICLLSEI